MQCLAITLLLLKPFLTTYKVCYINCCLISNAHLDCIRHVKKTNARYLTCCFSHNWLLVGKWKINPVSHTHQFQRMTINQLTNFCITFFTSMSGQRGSIGTFRFSVDILPLYPTTPIRLINIRACKNSDSPPFASKTGWLRGTN